MNECRSILNIIIKNLVVAGWCPYLRPVGTPVQSIDPGVIPAILSDQSVLALLHSINVDVIIVGANSEVTLIWWVFGYFAVVLGLFECLNFLVKIIQTPNTNFACIATDDQMVMFHWGSDCSRLLISGHFTHRGGHLDSLFRVVIIWNLAADDALVRTDIKQDDPIVVAASNHMLLIEDMQAPSLSLKVTLSDYTTLLAIFYLDYGAVSQTNQQIVVETIDWFGECKR